MKTKLKVADPAGLHRVLDERTVLPQAAERLDVSPVLAPDELRIAVERLNLDAASYRQLADEHHHDGAAVRRAVLDIVERRGKMQNPVTGSGGMLIGTVDEVGPESPHGLLVGDRVATLVSLTLTPLAITDGLRRWDGRSEQVPAAGHAIVFGRSIVAALPDDLRPELALAVYDVCGAPALTHRVVTQHVERCGRRPVVAVLGGAGKSGSLSLASARRAGAGATIAVVRDDAEAELVETAGIADRVSVADARNPVVVRDAVAEHGGPADITVVCVDVAGCEAGAILATAAGGTVIFFSMATSFAAAALTAEGLAADVTMLVGNGFVPGHAGLALDLVRTDTGVRSLFDGRL